MFMANDTPPNPKPGLIGNHLSFCISYPGTFPPRQSTAYLPLY